MMPKFFHKATLSHSNIYSCLNTLENTITTVACRRIYDTVDANRDEKLTFEEIHGFLNKLGIEMSDKYVETIVGRLSTSEDGSFKFKKFVSL